MSSPGALSWRSCALAVSGIDAAAIPRMVLRELLGSRCGSGGGGTVGHTSGGTWLAGALAATLPLRARRAAAST